MSGFAFGDKLPHFVLDWLGSMTIQIKYVAIHCGVNSFAESYYDCEILTPQERLWRRNNILSAFYSTINHLTTTFNYPKILYLGGSTLPLNPLVFLKSKKGNRHIPLHRLNETMKQWREDLSRIHKVIRRKAQFGDHKAQNVADFFFRFLFTNIDDSNIGDKWGHMTLPTLEKFLPKLLESIHGLIESPPNMSYGVWESLDEQMEGLDLQQGE